MDASVRRRAGAGVVLLLAASIVVLGEAGPDGARAEQPGGIRAGVGVADATWHVGASAGQYAEDGTPLGVHVDPFAGGPGTVEDDPNPSVDPHAHSTRRTPSYGVQSELSSRALVVEGSDGERVALVKNDLYIPQDLVNTRVATILSEHDRLAEAGLAEGPVTGIDETNLVIGVSHNHSSPMYTSSAWGVWAFQDVFDIRAFEYQAQAMADAVIEASASLVPARMAGATVPYSETQKHSFGTAVADDGTPAGYPQTDNDKSVSVLHFEDVSSGDPRPLANFVTLGQHPEGLEGNNLISGDWIAPMERMADLETGATTIFMQNNTGTSELDSEGRSHSRDLRREFSHREYAQAERNGRFIADAIRRAQQAAASCAAPTAPAEYRTDSACVPFARDFPVESLDLSYAPPESHPYPSVSNCRTHETAQGNPGVPIIGLPDCQRDLPVVTDAFEQLPFDPGVTVDALRAAGVPVPENYGAVSYTGLQETFQVHLQAVRLGDVLVTVCPCEQWSDQSLNIKTRANVTQDDMHLGFDWSEVCSLSGEGEQRTWGCEGGRDSRSDTGATSQAAWDRMIAQVTNPADGWDAGLTECNPENDGACPLRAESEPVETDRIKGNFTQSWRVGDQLVPAELSADQGYPMVLPVGMANDYWGYIATYREYQRGDHYRKALTGLGPHSADFLATRLVRMGAELRADECADEAECVRSVPFGPLDHAYSVDGEHQRARSIALGKAAQGLVSAYEAQLPPDGGEPAPVEQPSDIERFDATRFTWVGGSNYFDRPRAVVERLEDGRWVEAGDMSGEVVLTVDYPGRDEVGAYRAGAYGWKWSATFEAFSSDIDTGRGTQTPTGTYRFAVRGRTHEGGGQTAPYELTSETFEVEPWGGITVEDLRAEPSGAVSFDVGPTTTKTFYVGRYPKRDNTETMDLTVGPIDYPDTWQSISLPEVPETGERLFPRLERTVLPDESGALTQRYCFSCTFRPWADTGEVASATVTVLRPNGRSFTVPATLDADGRWRTAYTLRRNERAVVEPGGIVDSNDEVNGERSEVVRRTRGGRG